METIQPLAQIEIVVINYSTFLSLDYLICKQGQYNLHQAPKLFDPLLCSNNFIFPVPTSFVLVLNINDLEYHVFVLSFMDFRPLSHILSQFSLSKAIWSKLILF